jgi:hypothetical protein
MLARMYDDAIAWAQEHLGHDVTEVVPLAGGMTSAMLVLRGPRGAATVLRLMTQQPWRSHGHDLVVREAVMQQTLAATSIPAPLSRAVDPDGDGAGHPAHLMSLVPARACAELTVCREGTMARWPSACSHRCPRPGADW